MPSFGSTLGWTGTGNYRHVDDPWGKWVTTTVTTSNTSYQTWGQWTGTSQWITATPTTMRPPSLTRREEHDDFVADRQRRLEELGRAHAREFQRVQALYPREEASQRARETLRAILSEEERAVYDQSGLLFITGSAGNVYEIAPGYVGNVHLLEVDQRVASFCAHPPMRECVEGVWLSLPHEDAWIAQILALKTDEDAFLAKANLHQARPGWRYRRAVPALRDTEVVRDIPEPRICDTVREIQRVA